jgi:hypothetical protein
MFASINSFLASNNGAGQQAYTAPGTYTWTCPAHVTSISVVCVGAGSGAAGNLGGGDRGIRKGLACVNTSFHHKPCLQTRKFHHIGY